MTELLVLKEHLKTAYSNYGSWIQAALKGILVLLTCIAVNSSIGYMKLLLSPLILIILAVIAALLPLGASCVIVCGVIVGNLSAASIEMALLFTVICVLLFLLYFAFKPGNSHIMVLSVFLGILQFYGPLPIVIGLLCNPLALLPMTFGLIISSFISYVNVNYIQLTTAGSTLSGVQKILRPLSGVFQDEKTWVLIIILIAVALLVYMIRKMPVKYGWQIAIASGIILHLFLTLICDFVLGVGGNYVILIINLVIELVVGVILQFLFHMVDYTREEVLQFEDDEYCYYVKAVPKIAVTVPEVRVTRIKERNMKEVSRTSSQVTFVREDDYDEVVEVEDEEYKEDEEEDV